MNSFGDAFHYYVHEVWKSWEHASTKNYPPVSCEPWTPLLLTLAYLFFVKVFGPRWMFTRKPINLGNLVFWFDVFMMVINTFCFVGFGIYIKFGYKCFVCESLESSIPDAQSRKILLTVTWIFYISKFMDFMDTIFMVLRKRNDQITGLHLLHHTIAPMNVWMGIKFTPILTALVFPFLNAFVHAVMYLYYGLSSLGPRMRPYLWWKKYVTVIQIAHLTFSAVHYIYFASIASCNLNPMVFYLYVPQLMVLVVMFYSFFINTYKQKAGGRPKKFE